MALEKDNQSIFSEGVFYLSLFLHSLARGVYQNRHYRALEILCRSTNYPSLVHAYGLALIGHNVTVGWLSLSQDST